MTLVGHRRQYHLRPNAVALPAWGWVLVFVAVVTGFVGLVLAIAGHESVGALLMALTGIVLGGSVIIAHLNYYANGQRDS
jgi:hypothetical protein